MVYVEEYNGNPQAEFDELTKTVKKTSVLSSKWSNFSTGFIALFSSVFLPQGYPYTVTSDYLQYQIWDTIQAFASSLSGALSTSAVLRGVGVGNESATVLAASLTWLLKDGTGMVGRIIFAWAKGSALDSDCKRWRLVADILNDLAFFIELLSPHLPRIFFAPLACAASLFRSIVGVAGGATRTAITRHQARRENLADVAAKDGSQETLVNVFSLIISLILLPLVDGRPELVWTLFVLFTGVHLGANYRAVRALHLDTLNQSRLAIAVRQFIADRTVPKISEANEREPLFEQVTGPRHYGCQVQQTLGDDSGLFKLDNFSIIRFDQRRNEGWISLETSATPDNQLESAFCLEYRAFSNKWPETKQIADFRAKMKAIGWNLSSHQLSFDEWRYRVKGE